MEEKIFFTCIPETGVVSSVEEQSQNLLAAESLNKGWFMQSDLFRRVIICLG